jgi:hypothetical protein
VAKFQGPLLPLQILPVRNQAIPGSNNNKDHRRLAAVQYSRSPSLELAWKTLSGK